MERALDVSNYTGVFGAETVACWRSLGYDHLICGTQRPEVTRAQLAAATAGGMTVDAYCFLYWDVSPASQVQAALAAVTGFPVRCLWLDCEDATEGRAPETMVGLIAAAVAACGDFPCGIYTGRWWWVPATGDSTAFAHLPLWHAEWTAGPEVLPDFAAFRPYGGWTRPAMWQFQGTTQLCGFGVDLDLTDVPAMPPPAAAAPAPTELQVLRAERGFLRALLEGRYRLAPVRDVGLVELQQARDGTFVPLEPPCRLRLD